MSYHGFEVGRGSFSQFRITLEILRKLPSVVQLYYGFDIVGLITTSDDEFDALFYRIHCNKLARTQKGSSGGGGGGG